MSFIAIAQDDNEIKIPSEASKTYHEYKLYNNTCYTSSKISKWIKSAGKNFIEDLNDEFAEDSRGISPAKFKTLTAQELLIYCTIYPESYSQNCDAYPLIQDEEKKILAYLADNFNEYSLSQRQKKALKNKKTAVVKLIIDCASKNNRLGNVYKELLLDMNATKSIPEIIKIYKASQKKDADILTLLMLFMEEGKYKSFLKSGLYKKLYDEDVSSYDSFIDFNKANEALILKMAKAYHASLK